MRFQWCLPGNPQAGAEMDSPETGDNERSGHPSFELSVEFSSREVVGIDLPGGVIADQDVGGVLAETGGVGRTLL